MARTNTIRTIAVLLAVALLLVTAAPAFALSLDEAKSRGLVGERIDGYLGAVSQTPSPEVTALVAEINRKRKEKYKEIAQRNNTALNVVEKLAAKKAIEQTPAGQFVQNSAGAWVKK